MKLKERCCDGCQKPIQKAHARLNELSFCGTCYQKDFEPVVCEGCGKGTRRYLGQGEPLCKSCKILDRACVGCGKHLQKAARVIEEKRYCWPCVVKTLPQEPCERCGELAAPLSKAPSLGIEQRICRKCRDRLTKVTCGNCRKYRKPAGTDGKGRVICKKCLEEPIFICPNYSHEGLRYSGAESQSCYWTRKLADSIREGKKRFKQRWVQALYEQFGEDLIATHGSYYAYHHIDEASVVFWWLSGNISERSLPIEPKATLGRLGIVGIQKHMLVVRYLTRKEVIEPITKADEIQHNVRYLRQYVFHKRKHWYGSLLKEYLEYILRHYDISQERKLRGASFTTVYAQLNSVKRFLALLEKNDVQKIDSSTIDKLISKHPGDAKSLREFIEFLNRHK